MNDCPRQNPGYRMSRELFNVPKIIKEPEWGVWREDYTVEEIEGDLCKFKIQCKPDRMTPKRLRNTILKLGRRYYKLERMERVPGPPDSPPLRAVYVWGRLLRKDPLVSG